MHSILNNSCNVAYSSCQGQNTKGAWCGAEALEVFEMWRGHIARGDLCVLLWKIFNQVDTISCILVHLYRLFGTYLYL